MKKVFLFLALSVCFLTSCDESINPTLGVSSRFFEVDQQGDQIAFTINSSSKWEIATDELPDTVQLSQTSGDAGVFDITATISTNYSLVTLNHIIKISAIGQNGNTVVYVRVTQHPRYGFELSTVKETMPKEGGSVELYLSANDNWTATCYTEGVSVTPDKKSSGDYKVVVLVPENTTGKERIIEVIFSLQTNNERLIITQE